MSLKYRSSNGAETTVAGLAPAGQLVPSVSLYQSGTYTGSLPVGYSQNTVIFSEAMPDTDYIVTLSTGGSYGSLLLQVLSKTKSGFVFSALNENAGQLSSPEIKWQAFKLMTNEDRALDEARIEQNTTNFAPAFSEVTSYAVGDYVTYGGVLYKCTTAHTAGVWVAGHFTQVTVGGDIASKIPSTASSTEKLAYVEYSPSTSLYSTWAELLELLHQKGAGWWTGTIYIGKWYTYIARIVLGSSGYWYGSFLAKCAETEALVGASKTYGATNTWTVTNYVTDSDLNTYAKPHIYNLSGATYPTLQALFDELVARLKADAVGNDYGICFMGTWSGKSFFEGSFYTVDGHSSYFKITFQNPQDSKSLYTGYTGYSDVQVTYTGVA